MFFAVNTTNIVNMLRAAGYPACVRGPTLEDESGAASGTPSAGAVLSVWAKQHDMATIQKQKIEPADNLIP